MSDPRPADLVPSCFETEGVPFRRAEVERFFAARRDLVLGDGERPLTPLARQPDVVQRRWRLWLAMAADRDADPEDRKTVEAWEKALVHEGGEDRTPWRAEGVSRSTWFRRRSKDQ